MLKDNIFVLDLGTTKFCLCGLFSQNKSTESSIETISIPARGMRRGMLSDLKEAKNGINQLLDIAEKQFEVDINKIAVGVAGSHLSGRIITHHLDLDYSRVQKDTIKSMIDEVKYKAKRKGKEILHIIPIKYKVDNRESTENPIDFTGKSLKGEFYLIEGDTYYLKDIIHTCNQCGVEITQLYSEPIASASVAVDNNLKKLGVAIADIGGGTTDGVVYIDGKISEIFTLNIAGIMMTNDLAIGLNTSFEEAEKVKQFFGIYNSRSNNNEFAITNSHGCHYKIQRKDVYPIIGARVYELSYLLAKKLFPYKGLLGAGIVLTGGGAEIKGICEILQKKYDIPVTNAKPSLIRTGLKSHFQRKFPTKFATVIGLINLEIERHMSLQKNKKSVWSTHYFSLLKNWIKELS